MARNRFLGISFSFAPTPRTWRRRAAGASHVIETVQDDRYCLQCFEEADIPKGEGTQPLPVTSARH